MSDALGAEVRQHVQNCRSLLRDLEGLLDDLTFQSENHGTIRYAVDTSELYAYVFPQENLRAMRNFTDDSDDVALAAQYGALKRLFFQLPHKPILLEPHLLEFSALVERIRDWQFHELATDTAMA